MSLFQTLENSQFRVEDNSFEQLDSRASQQVKEGKGSESTVGQLKIPAPALSWLLLPQLLHRHAAGVVEVMGPVLLEGI